MGNYRNKMRQAGCQEVIVNAGKISRSNPDREPPYSNIKRPKRAKVNFLPTFPKQRIPQTIVEEVKKTEKNLPLIKKMMQTTFALRRQTIVRTCPRVNELMDLWPALKMENDMTSTPGVPPLSMPFLCICKRTPLDFSEPAQKSPNQSLEMLQWPSLQSSVTMAQVKCNTSP
ncbi:hypothetical protein F7725_007488 [Dissostichus mawsoni]|uniref:Uncharacterized protein n=1 Tax=Dissostichus mawsoni TaxID=36200 RepID=A0A7J5Y4I7_DISMA|nr:hypothetical protein F7725_007488 [Dissostichus mawsoni]